MQVSPVSISKKLYQIIESRKGDDPNTSYVSSLFQKGIDSILKKIGEESSEVIIAAKNPSKENLVHELADLYFHCMVLMSQQTIKIEEVENELKNRFGVSGIKEKRKRKVE